MRNPKNYQKYFWPTLAVVLVILLLLCHWQGDTDVIVDEGAGTKLIGTFTYAEDCFPCYSSDTDTMVITGLECDGKLFAEIGRWWEPSSELLCDTPPAPDFPYSDAVEWEFFDSTYTLHKWFESDNMPTNTMSPWSGTRVNNLVWDGTPWRLTVQNNLITDINVEWQIDVYEICDVTSTSETETPAIPGFELLAFICAIGASIILIKSKKR